MILRCTKKLLTVLRVVQVEPAPAPDDEDWYANLIRLDRKQCLLLTHTGTLFTIFQPAVTAADLRLTHELVTSLIDRELRNESLPPDTFGDLASQTLDVAKTADRAVLGCMNDMAFRCEYVVADSSGLLHTDLPALNNSLRRNINSSRDYRQPIELVADRLTHRDR